MRTLSGAELLDVWEAGQAQHALDRALVLLRSALPERGWDELGALSIGQRDLLLLALYQTSFGDALACYTECPECAARLEFSLRVADLQRSTSEQAAATD